MADAGRGHGWPLVGRERELAVIAEHLERGVSVVIAGDAGVGKTRLAREAADAQAGQGRRIVRVAASRTTASIPYGAVATLLPIGKTGTRAPEELHRLMLDALTRDAPLVLVDDADQLDAPSAAAIRQASVSGAVVIATVRTGAAALPAAEDLQGFGERLDIRPLLRPDADRLVRGAVGRTVEPATLQELWQAGQGNPLFVHDMVLGAIDAGLLRERDGVTRLEGHLARVPRLRELVDARLGDLEPAEREAIEVLALGEPLGLAQLVVMSDAQVVESLERRGLAIVENDGARRPVRVAHPLYAEVLRGALPAIASLRHVRSLADAVEARGARRRDDPLRVALWRLEAGGATSPALLVQAARLARAAGNDTLAARLARAAYDAGGGVEAALLLSVALGGLGRNDEAAAVIAALPAELVADERELAATAIRLAEERWWGLGEYDEAEAMLRDAGARLSGAARDDAEAQRAVFAVLRGEFDHALELGRPLVDSTDLRVVGRASIAVALALGYQGATDEALAISARARAHPDAAMEGHVVVHDVAQALALIEAGRISEADALVSARYQEALVRPAALPRAWLPMMLGSIALLEGDLSEASASFDESAAAWSELGLVAVMRWALAGVAMTRAARGDGPGARQAMERLEVAPLGQFLMMEPIVECARAWADHSNGTPIDARRLADSGLDALASGAPAHSGAVMHELARLGALEHAREVRAGLPAAEDTWPLQAARIGYVDALSAADAGLLERASDAFTEIGCALFAAESLAGAAAIHRAQGDPRSGSRCAARANQLLVECGEAATPALAGLDPAPGLSRREREVADLVIRGQTNREIAETLIVSERTIDNHVQRMFAKLGITRRSDLSAALKLSTE